ncbi:PhzF family phenazine biosynthesis protein [Microbacteriaceae bacterium K1510]|uniref:PhzF family phenazine biosynthesis protein n=1 Tax=Microbacterium sp. 4NA327F11 TaxID=2502229 RepID=UPI0010F7915E|nr:PhzF family phenazine biosynthesis protein [Microbacterium sp. 4NA327F11]MCK9913859.1 PhzF family phenazine biosynthesis protein [Microbacteriaceae bacterium K1510]
MSFGVQVDVVRVFTDARGGSGNPLGIVMSSAASQGREQSIAEALGYSETVFIGGITPDAAQVRIFTPARELPFAGHPSVGTAWWLARRGTPVAALEVPAGRVVIDIDGEDVAVRARPGWTPDFAFRQLGSPAEIDALDPATFTEGHHYLWAWADETAGTVRSRMFAPDMGIVEDPATGAAAVRLTGLVARDLDITQGEGCRLRTRWLGGEVSLSGRVAPDSAVEI